MVTKETQDSSKEFKGYAAYAKGEPVKPFSYHPRVLGPNDVEIAISHASICGSDIHTIDSGWGPTMYPAIVGHEIVGTVAQVGSHVTDFKKGQRVGVGPFVHSCSECKYCKKGMDNLCTESTQAYNSKYPDGVQSHGGYAEAIRVCQHWVFDIPESIPSETAAPLLCAGVTTYTPLKKHNVKKGDRVGIIGIGGLGHIALQWAKAMGATVTAISHSDSKKADATKFGAESYINFGDKEAVKKGKRTLDLIVSTVNRDDMDWDALMSLLEVGGTFVFLGLPEGALKMRPSSLLLSQIKLEGSLVGTSQDTKDMLRDAAKWNITVASEVVPMTKVNDAIQKVRNSTCRYRMVLTNPV